MDKLLLIAGPCVIENDSMPFQIAASVQELCARYGIDFIFKASYKKANRTSVESFTGIETGEALKILSDIRNKYNIPVLTDVHEAGDIAWVSDHVDYLQIPAFLSRQTDLLIAAGKSGKAINIKKGQFASPESMAFAVEKVKSTGNQNVFLTERGTTFGYQDLVVDFRSIPIMQAIGVKVIVDSTHSLQKPNQTTGVTGGNPEMIATICKAAVAVGADGLFIETHPDPATALSDGANMLPLDQLENILAICCRIRRSINNTEQE